MKTIEIFTGPRARSQAGYSTLMMLILIGATAILLSSTLSRTYTSAKLNDRYSYFTVCNAAAEAATQKVLANMITDIEQSGGTVVSNNLSLYRTNLIPAAGENPYWTNFQFSDGQGNTNRTYVAQISTNSNPPLLALQSQYPGLLGFSQTYRIYSQVTPKNANYNFSTAVLQDVQIAQIPVFQYAIFYNSLLEFTIAFPFTIAGRVHSNSNIYVGSMSNLTFNSTVTTTGVITNPPWAGVTDTNNYTGSVTFNGNPQFGTALPNLVLPIGTNSTAPSNIIQIIYPPPSTESRTSAMGVQRFYNKAGMVIMVSNTTFYASNTIINITLQSPNAGDPSPLHFTSGTTNWTNNNFSYWFSTTNITYDQRQGQWMQLSQINVSNFNTWCLTNVNIYTNYFTNTPKFNASSPLNIVYVGDWRKSNGSTNVAVRLMGGGSANFPAYGLTVATPDPLYIWGNYNTPLATNLNSGNVAGTYPTSFISDALTILSGNWSDASSSSSYTGRVATSTTVNGAMITGMVYSTGPAATEYSGGVNNLPRLLEDWSSVSLTLNTSMINLYPSAIATAQWQFPWIYYAPPNIRQFNMNTNYLTLAGLPPGTPEIYALMRSDWSVAPPNNVSYATPVIDYVPR